MRRNDKWVMQAEEGERSGKVEVVVEVVVVEVRRRWDGREGRRWAEGIWLVGVCDGSMSWTRETRDGVKAAGGLIGHGRGD